MIFGALLISILGLLIFYFLLLLLDKRKLKKLKKSYDEKNDYSKEGEKRRGDYVGGFQESGNGKTDFGKREQSLEGSGESERRILLPTTTSSSDGKNSKSNRKNLLRRKLRRR
jgi:hypothetical protein